MNRYKNRIIGNSSGFSLIEVIAVLALLGILSTMAVMGIGEFAQNFVFARASQATAAKGQLAMMRLVKEFQTIVSAGTATSTHLAYTAQRGGGTENHDVNLSVSGSQVLLDSQVLIDQVNVFSLTYYNTYNGASSPWSTSTRIIEISLTLTSGGSILPPLVSRVALRDN